MMIKVNLSRILGELRMDVRELAIKSSIHENTLYNIYNEKTKGIQYNILSKLCATLDRPVGDFLEYVPDKNN